MGGVVAGVVVVVVAGAAVVVVEPGSPTTEPGKYPVTSMITCVAANTKMQILPPVPTLAVTAFEIV